MDKKKRDFMKKVALGAAAAAVASPAIAAVTAVTDSKKTYEWSMATSWPKNYPVLGTGMEKLAELINVLTKGRIKIKVFAAGEIVPAFEVFDAVSRGTVQIGHTVPYYSEGKSPVQVFFSNIPLGLTMDEMNAWLFFGGGLKLWQESLASFNLIPFQCMNTGLQWGGWFNKKINSPADLKGLKIRIPGVTGEIYRQLGATPVNIPGGEIFTAMKSGVIDAVEWTGPHLDMAFGLQRAAKYYYYPGAHEPGTNGVLYVNKKAYEELPEDLKETLRCATQTINLEGSADLLAHNISAYHELKKLNNIEILPFPESVMKQFKITSMEVLTQLANKSAETKKAYASLSEFLSLAKEYSKVSMLPYLIARDT